MPTPLQKPTVAQRLLARASLDRNTGCWVWIAASVVPHRRRYPAFAALGERFARRVAWKLWRGPIPPGHWVTTSCGNDLCINPWHAEAEPPSEVFKRYERPRRAARPPPTHCKRGHELTVENTIINVGYVERGGARKRIEGRTCKTCRDAWRTTYKPKRKPKPPRPPTPSVYEERLVEMAIRRVENTTPKRRLDRFLREVGAQIGWSTPFGAGPPALAQETHEAYFDRTGNAGRWEDWFTSRMLAEPRIREALRKLGTVVDADWLRAGFARLLADYHRSENP